MMGLFRRLRARFRYRQFDADLRRELEEHRALTQAALEADGHPSDTARRQAARALGNVTLARESARAVWIAPWLDGVRQDVRYALRGLRASPAFTLPVLGVFVITMGLTTSLFVTVESVLFRPWPVPDADRVVSLITVDRAASSTRWTTGVMEYRHLRDHAGSLDLVAMDSMSLRLGTTPDTPPSTVRLVSDNYFSALRLPLAAGRPLAPGDDEAGGAAAAVISHGLWHRQFGGTSDAVGAVLHIGGVPFTVVGIAAAGATDEPSAVADAWIPLHARLALPGGEPSPHALLEAPRGCCVRLAGRLEEGADLRTADAEMRALAAQFAAAHGIAPLEISVTSTALANQPMAERALRLFSLLGLATALVLLLGCANVGNLQLARGLSRQRELAVRLALGASRGRVVRQLLVEGGVLALAGAGLSVLVAHYLPRFILQQDSPTFASLVSLDGSTIVFAFALAMAASLASGLLPALRTTQVSLGTRAVGVSRPGLRSTLLGLQVAISVILLIGTGLLVRGIHHATRAGLGFNPYGAAVVSLGLPSGGDDQARRGQVSRRIAEELAHAGHGLSAGTAFVPFGTYRRSDTVRLPGEDGGREPRPVVHQVTPGYFELLGIPVVSGRVFDADAQPDEVVINQSLARLLWPDQSAVGRVFLESNTEKRVVGVVADARTERLEYQWPALYQSSGVFTAVLVRTDAAAVAGAEDLIRRFEPRASPAVVDVVSDLRRQLAPSIAGATAAAALGALALLLAAVGTLGVFAYLVTERLGEIGVRRALGARAWDILALLGARVSWPLGGGLATGVTVALAVGRVLAGSLHGISPYDPVTYLAVFCVLAGAAFVAALIPARRALRVDPAITLRHD